MNLKKRTLRALCASSEWLSIVYSEQERMKKYFFRSLTFFL